MSCLFISNTAFPKLDTVSVLRWTPLILISPYLRSLLTRLHLKSETNSSLRFVVFWIKKHAIFILEVFMLLHEIFHVKLLTTVGSDTSMWYRVRPSAPEVVRTKVSHKYKAPTSLPKPFNIWIWLISTSRNWTVWSVSRYKTSNNK
jgi:hypothetical protein